MKHTLPSMLLSGAAACLLAPAAEAQSPSVTSCLEIFDIAAGTHTVIREFPFLIEAPNWSLDGKWLLVNKGGRLFRIAPGLDDGPEYSPDGKHIWFNSVRSGNMQVWRMNADGTSQTQLTFDHDRNSWNPESTKFAFVSYRLQ